jgi:hypothetical protein
MSTRVFSGNLYPNDYPDTPSMYVSVTVSVNGPMNWTPTPVTTDVSSGFTSDYDVFEYSSEPERTPLRYSASTAHPMPEYLNSIAEVRAKAERAHALNPPSVPPEPYRDPNIPSWD